MANAVFSILIVVLFLGGAYVYMRGDTEQVMNSSQKQTMSSQQLQEGSAGDVEGSVLQNNQSQQDKNMDLNIEMVKEGTGDRVTKKGDTLEMHYTGTLLNGTKFDSSVDRGTPFTFTLGAGQVIKGWDEGLLGMKVGEKRKLTIPADMAYGSQGAGDIIPPNSTLIFETELLSIK